MKIALLVVVYYLLGKLVGMFARQIVDLLMQSVFQVVVLVDAQQLLHQQHQLQSRQRLLQLELRLLPLLERQRLLRFELQLLQHQEQQPLLHFKRVLVCVIIYTKHLVIITLLHVEHALQLVLVLVVYVGIIQ